MKIIILNVYKPEALDFLDGFDYAAIIVEENSAEELIECINKAKDLKFEDRNFFSLSWWDGSPYFVNSEDITEEEQETLNDKNFIVVDRAVPPSLVSSRVGLCRLIADEEGVWWEARPKHVDYEVETRELPLEFLEKLKRGEA